MEERTKSDVSFGIALFLAFFGVFGSILYYSSKNPENPIDWTAMTSLLLFISSWIAIYISKSYEWRKEDIEFEEELKLAFENQIKINKLKGEK